MSANRLLASLFFLALLTACNSQPTFVDNGNPGQIKVVVYYDDNQNSKLDAGETGTREPLAREKGQVAEPGRLTPMDQGPPWS